MWRSYAKRYRQEPSRVSLHHSVAGWSTSSTDHHLFASLCGDNLLGRSVVCYRFCFCCSSLHYNYSFRTSYMIIYAWSSVETETEQSVLEEVKSPKLNINKKNKKRKNHKQTPFHQKSPNSINLSLNQHPINATLPPLIQLLITMLYSLAHWTELTNHHLGRQTRRRRIRRMGRRRKVLTRNQFFRQEEPRKWLKSKCSSLHDSTIATGWGRRARGLA